MRSLIDGSLFACILLLACQTKLTKDTQVSYGGVKIPMQSPLPFLPEKRPFDSIIHRGVLTPDLSEYYFTVSDRKFQNFNVRILKKEEDVWGIARDAFFNSEYSEPGMSFSPDGQSLYFSSTRPRFAGDTAIIWRIWRSQKKNDNWSEPMWIAFPGLEKPLHSHPSIDKYGNLFFHASNLDYSDMNVYQSVVDNEEFSVPVLIGDSTVKKCTPYISADGSFLFYAIISDPMKLMYCQREDDGSWSTPNGIVPDVENIKHQGNPFHTGDGRFLFFATEHEMDAENWNIYWMQTPE